MVCLGIAFTAVVISQGLFVGSILYRGGKTTGALVLGPMYAIGVLTGGVLDVGYQVDGAGFAFGVLNAALGSFGLSLLASGPLVGAALVDDPGVVHMSPQRSQLAVEAYWFAIAALVCGAVGLAVSWSAFDTTAERAVSVVGLVVGALGVRFGMPLKEEDGAAGPARSKTMGCALVAFGGCFLSWWGLHQGTALCLQISGSDFAFMAGLTFVVGVAFAFVAVGARRYTGP